MENIFQGLKPLSFTNKIAVMITIKKVWFTEDQIFVRLNDGHIIGTPIEWYPNLSRGTKEQLLKFELWENGKWLHWEELDEDLSAEGFLVFRKEFIKEEKV
jgi:hypothetical protein